ncbi:LuxR C-terminal-related transcriptional regulator [Streptomyces sp. NBC_01077]|uniref:LuxR C-terminal-related transcriptional regulator n=1 Tax=Streptomyces sp. NBC_01077 TaxID=2903746 RepID=UPI00387015A2|nr:LuxR C-terminal-related transcriptional regulator [Streptomyces sp. NBC_01077]WSV43561.1 LuxR C-terminal-related transcriptional regulator [Streptomyces sp. NBC_01077]
MAVHERATTRWPLTGRDEELRQFAQVWADRRCRGVAIFGPPGVGKSRLAEECIARAGKADFKTGRATATAAAGTVPLGAIAHLLPADVDMAEPVEAFKAVVNALAGPQRSRWAFLIDDLQLLDAASAMLLQQLTDAGVVRVVGTVRTGEPVSEAVQTLTSGEAVHRIDLSEFDPQQTEAVLGAALGGRIRRHTLHRLRAVCGGNALFLWELVSGALKAGTLRMDKGAWELAGDRVQGTPKLAELISTRLQEADPNARPVLELLALTEPLPLADAQAKASTAILMQLEKTGLIRVTTDRRRFAVQFSHPLYGEVLRDQIPRVRRRSLQVEEAQRVKSHGIRRRGDPLNLAVLQLASEGTAAPDLLIRAASLARHAHDYRQVINLLQALPPEQHTHATHLLLGEAHSSLKQFDEAEIHFLRSYESAATDDEIVRSAQEWNMNFQMQGRMKEALDVLMRAQERVGEGHGRGTLQVNEGIHRCAAGEPVPGLRLLEAVDELEKDIANPQVLDAWLYGSLMRATYSALAGKSLFALGVADHAHAVHTELERESQFQQPIFQRVPLIIALSELGRFTEARSVGREVITHGLSEHLPVTYLWGLFFTARSEFFAGRIREARDLYDEASREAHKQNDMFGTRLIDSGFAAAAAMLGDLPAAEAVLAESQQHPASGILVGEDSLGDVWVQAAQGHLGQARKLLFKAAAAAQDAGYATSEALLLTEAARLGGAPDVVTRLSQLADACDGNLAAARAHLAVAFADGAPELLEEVAGELQETGADLLAAEAFNTAAVAWRRRGGTRHATAAEQRGKACADRCQGVRTELLARAESTAVLTRREQEVAHLAARDMSSRDIATSLHLSVRTVDNHLQHAYTKLGVTNRRELAQTLSQADAP